MTLKSQHFIFKRFRSRTVYGLFAIVLILSMAMSSAAFAQETKPFTVTPLTPDTTYSIPKGFKVNAQGLTSVVVKIKGSALASYQGEIAGYPATSPSVTGETHLNVKSNASISYLGYLEQKQAAVKAQLSQIPGAQVVHEFTVVLNAISVVLPASEVDSLSNLADVEAVYPDVLETLDTDNSPQFIGAPTVWTALGGQESSGEGVIVGVLDTGIWPEHPSFSDPDPSGKPYAPPPVAPSGDSRLCQFSEGANPGPAFTCNNKLIAAYYEMATYVANIDLLPAEYTSARDADGHGTHTSSTSAGNAGVEASIFDVSRGTVSGIAPRAHVIMYKVCGVLGCYSSDSASAVQQAILDGVDVINFSISGGANPYSDVGEQAFLDAYNAGIFVAASAGNSGPTVDTTDHRGGWVTTVAASTQNRAFENTLTLTSGSASLTLSGTSLTSGVGPASVVVYAPDLLCNDPLPAGSVTGKVVVCKRGTTGRAEKGYNVLQGGAVGMILYNQAANVTDLETDSHWLPATHIQYSQGLQVLAFITAHPDAQATLTEGLKVATQGDVMASFSSRGGLGQTLGVSKPDITAPGVQILAGASPVHLPPDQGDGVALGPQGELFQAIAGTSMSSPHIAGSGALLKALHPDWTPGQIKSALMTTAWTQVLKEDGVTPATVFDDGSGRVDLTKAGDPGLTFNVSGVDYAAHSSDLWNVNYPSVFVPSLPGIISVTRVGHSTLAYDSTWSLSVQGAETFKVIVPGSLSVPAGSDGAFSITIDASDVPVNVSGSATLYLTETDGQGTRSLHIPITFIRKVQSISLAKTCTSPAIQIGSITSCTITATNNSFSPASVAITDILPDQLKAVAGTVVGGTVSPDLQTISWFGNLGAATPPSVTIGVGSSPAGYLPLSGFGVTPIAGVGDETIVNYNVPAFTYAGETYTRLGVVSNGYLVVGGGTGADVDYLNQDLPDPTPPNNVLAPFWTDFDPGAPAGGAIRITTLADGANTWIVVDWAAVKEYSTLKVDSFEVWIGLNTNTNPGQDISFVYGTLEGNGDGGTLTVGAENRFGGSGENYYYSDGFNPPTGTLPTSATELVVGGTPPIPGETHTITFDAQRVLPGPWINYVHMTSDMFQGIDVAKAPWGAVLFYMPAVMK